MRSVDVNALSDWRETAEWDWVELGKGQRLHAVATIVNDDADDEWYGDGTTVCGLGGRMWIPGIFTRMSATRCRRCCERTGMPQGDQSPKNVDECRPIVKARLAELRGRPHAVIPFPRGVNADNETQAGVSTHFTATNTHSPLARTTATAKHGCTGCHDRSWNGHPAAPRDTMPLRCPACPVLRLYPRIDPRKVSGYGKQAA